MSFSKLKELHRDVIHQVTQEHLQLATFLPFDAVQLAVTFTKDELDDLENLLVDMRSATSANERSSALINNIGSYAAPIIKLLQLAKIIV